MLIPLHHTCPNCQSKLKAPEQYAGKKIHCPVCRTVVTLPILPQAEPDEIVMAEVVPEPLTTEQINWDIQFLDGLHGPQEVREFLEPPTAKQTRGDEGRRQEPKRKPGASSPAKPAGTSAAKSADSGEWMKRMFAAVLDPRSIQWLLTLGGGLMVLGGLIWLISWGAFESPLIAALILGVASLGVLAGGGTLILKTRFRVAGRALAFLGCIFISLNLWFSHAQGLVALENGLWMGGVVCVLLYIATVWILRDPLFMYAVQGGVTLTAVLLLGNFGLAGNATPLSVLLMGLALVSIHAYMAFPTEGSVFTRESFGLPMFWCGHGQLAVSLGVLLGSQLAGAIGAIAGFFELPGDGILLTESRWASGLLWLAGAYAYLYSDLAVRRIGLYIYLAAISLVMAEVTFVGVDLIGIEGLIACLAITATTISVVSVNAPKSDVRIARAVPPLALVLSILPVALGLLVHVRASSVISPEAGLTNQTTWMFVAVMFLVAISNRVSAFVYQRNSDSLSAAYIVFSAGALVVAAAGTLRMLDMITWHAQSPWLLWIPIGYIVAARLWRGEAPERPVSWVAYISTAIILGHVIFGSLAMLWRGFEPEMHFRLTIILGEAALFYALAAIFHRNNASTYAAVAASCAAVWQLMLYLALPQEFFTLGFAFVGLALVLTARWLGLQDEHVFLASGCKKSVTRGPGAAVLRAGHVVLLFALIVASMKGLAQLAAVGLDIRELSGSDWGVLGLMTAAAISGAVATPSSNWCRVYATCAVALAGLSFLMLNIAIDLSPWRKMEIFLVVVGILMFAASLVGRFREDEKGNPNEMVSFGLWAGSALATLPLIAAVFYRWNSAQDFSLYDELTLIGVTILMLTTGVVLRIKASTLFGGGTLVVYLCVLIVSIIYQPQIAIGIYLTAGGGLLFAAGLALAFYRDYLLALPDRVANREGVFSVISWR